MMTVLALAGALMVPGAARAQSPTTLGVGSGAVAGALVAGPVGAVAGAVVGGLIGHSSERGRRHVARRRHVGAVRRASQRRAEARPPRTAWTDPR